ncbi:hypothetical protein kac65v162_gp011 [Nodularia phage vB_NspS-kac65v162]|jgi:hypothetical protein|uniref:Uncharacterized protein n=3 Tax=Ravarandavirus kac65v151 TaxID=2845689 RepID=A0A482MHU2_9CAUD|nr:hypothetical protein HWC12_gp011 [Nodularia phage vB_NspS-kac65v151]QBQ73043.1 hypothetical protein kac65v151_gp011 [Nodularia phage vB_NspS-kac65v151]QBQ73249.1 hypothetical protein kac65v161_gp011 [Nodularia phage vB_NspS-kac65v161]QBQ73455.1 hypothetical protein kac65v162_gp011 [Nodularia phage vB_NspS-kac65v162]
MPKKIHLELIDLQAADMIARGRSREEVIRHFGKSKGWLEGLFKRQEFVDQVDTCRKNYMASIQQATQQNIFEDIQYSREKTRELRNVLMDLSIEMLGKSHSAITTITDDEIEALSPMQKAQFAKMSAEVAEKAISLNDQVLGLAKLQKSMEEIQKLGGFGIYAAITVPAEVSE